MDKNLALTLLLRLVQNLQEPVMVSTISSSPPSSPGKNHQKINQLVVPMGRNHLDSPVLAIIHILSKKNLNLYDQSYQPL